jgi:hypothetical protein
MLKRCHHEVLQTVFRLEYLVRCGSPLSDTAFLYFRNHGGISAKLSEVVNFNALNFLDYSCMSQAISLRVDRL